MQVSLCPLEAPCVTTYSASLSGGGVERKGVGSGRSWQMSVPNLKYSLAERAVPVMREVLVLVVVTELVRAAGVMVAVGVIVLNTVAVLQRVVAKLVVLIVLVRRSE